MSSTFTALSADDVGADIKAFLDVLGMPDHIHVENTGFVETLNYRGWRDADGGDEEFGARVDDDGD